MTDTQTLFLVFAWALATLFFLTFAFAFILLQPNITFRKQHKKIIKTTVEGDTGQAITLLLTEQMLVFLKCRNSTHTHITHNRFMALWNLSETKTLKKNCCMDVKQNLSPSLSVNVTRWQTLTECMNSRDVLETVTSQWLVTTTTEYMHHCQHDTNANLMSYSWCNSFIRDMYNRPDFTVNHFFMKLFRMSDISVVHYCQSLFALDLPSVTLARRFAKFCLLENMRVC